VAVAWDLGTLAIAVTLLVAGASKLLSPHPLARGLGQVYAWAGARRRLAAGLARGIACVEVVAALLVATRWWSPAGYLLAGVVGLGIAGFATSALTRGRAVACGCFGETGGRPVGAVNVLAGLGLVVGSAILLVVSERSSGASDAVGFAVARSVPAPDPTDGTLLGLTSVLALAVVLVRHRSRLLDPFRRHFRSFKHPSFQEGAEARG
jgi:hypothetical protein